ncbi:histidine phosphotransferase family protein [Frigidibacter sp. ROC022]|uniref:histidine phosphotransferase family protein n=1 Tax=Frigidibacter sp. ROC022 TaxID=2971796 RepID=UPI00215AC0C5|nr:histidine phosphotransferase family protein [Frigidibacter sp. ROC022]MCR8723929.1 histidine phosphotransferase family protein [Frigidibacter sp. ROC022]
MNRTVILTSLLGSRICHDLISPLGAIGNGVELLSMSGVVAGPEISLIAESVTNANARIRFYRIAFGAAAWGQSLARPEIIDILGALAKDGRQTILWQVEGTVERPLVKLAFLCLQCLESALPWGGRITVSERDGAWLLSADSTKFRDLDGLWSVFDDPHRIHDLAPADLHFALAPIWAGDIGLQLKRSESKAGLSLAFSPA